jgi:hypothetical protein
MLIGNRFTVPPSARSIARADLESTAGPVASKVTRARVDCSLSFDEIEEALGDGRIPNYGILGEGQGAAFLKNRQPLHRGMLLMRDLDVLVYVENGQLVCNFNGERVSKEVAEARKIEVERRLKNLVGAKKALKEVDLHRDIMGNPKLHIDADGRMQLTLDQATTIDPSRGDQVAVVREQLREKAKVKSRPVRKADADLVPA